MSRSLRPFVERVRCSHVTRAHESHPCLSRGQLGADEERSAARPQHDRGAVIPAIDGVAVVAHPALVLRIDAVRAELAGEAGRQVLVAQDLHERRPGLRGLRRDGVFAREARSVAQGGLDVFALKLRSCGYCSQQVVYRIACCEEVQENMYGHRGSANARLTAAHCAILAR